MTEYEILSLQLLCNISAGITNLVATPSAPITSDERRMATVEYLEGANKTLQAVREALKVEHDKKTKLQQEQSALPRISSEAHQQGVSLNFSNDSKIENPSDEQIAHYLCSEKEFAVIAYATDKSATYMQFVRSGIRMNPGLEDHPLNLEYQVDSESHSEEHFRAINSVTMKDIVRAFQKFAKGDDSWHSDFQWERTLH